MNRHICRAKHYGTGEWVYGYYAECLYYLDDEACGIIIPPNTTFYPHNGLDSVLIVDHTTICRYTGLNDKQGNPIFEGDIITARYVDDGRLTKGVVNFLNGCFCVKYDNHNNPAMDMLYEYEISGNVFNNTELMEE